MPDLLANGPLDTEFVVEVDTDGTAHLRFGDNTNGLLPASGTAFTAQYRIGNGTAGNVGADSLTQFAADPNVVSCINPLPASGGIDPETADQIRRRAPQAFLTQERAITMTDYATVAEANTQVEDAAATLRWTGSWYTAFITAEPPAAATSAHALRTSLTQYVNRYRLAGQDIKIESPDYVSLEIKLDRLRGPELLPERRRAIRCCSVLGSGTLPDGQPALLRTRPLHARTDRLPQPDLRGRPVGRRRPHCHRGRCSSRKEHTPRTTCTAARSRWVRPGRAHGQRPQPARPRPADPRDGRRKVTTDELHTSNGTAPAAAARAPACRPREARATSPA